MKLSPASFIFRDWEDNVNRLPSDNTVREHWKRRGKLIVYIVYGGGPQVTEWCKARQRYVDQRK